MGYEIVQEYLRLLISLTKGRTREDTERDTEGRRSEYDPAVELGIQLD